MSNRKGSNHWNAKLTEDDIANIHQIHKDYLSLIKHQQAMSPEKIMATFGYRGDDKYYEILAGKKSRTTTFEMEVTVRYFEEKRKINREKIRNISPEVMAKKFEITPQHYRDIVNGKFW
jgi:hypothetical protein